MRYGLGIANHDAEGRVVTAEFDSFYLLCVYVPNSGDGLRRLVIDFITSTCTITLVLYLIVSMVLRIYNFHY